MFRTRLTRLITVALGLFIVGCNSSSRGGGLCSTCGSGGGLFSRSRSHGEAVMVSGGECCDRTVSGPILPATPGIVMPGPQPGGVIAPAPLPNGTIPQIQDAPQKEYRLQQNNTRTGIKTNIETRPTKEGF